MAYSFSRLKTYEMCPKRFKFRYIDGLPDKTGEAAKLGSLVHEALEHDDVSMVMHDTNAYHMFQTGKKIMDSLNIRDKEIKLAIDSKGNPTDYEADNALFRGIVDVLGDDFILDWKTGFKTPNPIQLGAYQLLAEAHGHFVSEVKYAMLRYDKFETLPATPELFNESRKWLIETINTLEGDSLFERNVDDHCNFCPYTKECGMELEDTPEDKAVELKVLQSRIKQIKQDLQEYVKNTGNEIVSEAGIFGDKSKVSRRCLDKRELIKRLNQDGLLNQYAEVKSSNYENLLEEHPEYSNYFKDQIRNSFGFKKLKIAAE